MIQNRSRCLEHVYSYVYDPRDRIAQVTKTPVGGVATTEEYVHDANDNIVSSTIDGVTTTSTYDRNRLQTTSTGAVTTASNYDPFGRLDTLTVAGEVVQRYRYDGFDRIAEQQSLGTETSTTRFRYDPLNRTIERIDDAGTAEAETTSYEYLGTSSEDARETGAHSVVTAPVRPVRTPLGLRVRRCVVVNGK